MSYFVHLNTVEAIKAHYRKLAFENHPDRNHSPDAEEVFKAINNEYHAALKRYDGQKSHDSSGNEHTYRYNDATEQEIMDKLYELLKIRGNLEIDLIGAWLWISGDTKTHKEALKAAGCKWHSKRYVWYYKPSGYKRSRQSHGDLNELAAKYGSRTFRTSSDDEMPSKVA